MEAKNIISEIEGEHLRKLTVRRYGLEFEIYPWLKSRLFHKLMMGQEVLKSKNFMVLFTQLSTLSYGFFNIFRNYDAWAFTTSSERVLIDGKYTDKSMDYIGNNCGLKMLVVELQLFRRFKRRQVASQYVVSRAWLIFIEELYLFFCLRKVKINNESVFTEVQKRLNLQINTLAITKKYLAQYRIMSLILSRLPKPKVVFITVSYANFGYIRAFKEHNIRVVEIQHGLIGENHFSYRYGYAPSANQFPDEILVFGQRDKSFFQNQTRIPIRNVVVIGSFVLEHFHRKATINKVPFKRILVSLQDSHWSVALLDFIVRFNQLVPNKIEWIIQTRRTPQSYYRQKYEFSTNVKFSELSIYEAIAECDAHLTIFSTTALESLSIGKPTFLYNYEGASRTYLDFFLREQPHSYFFNSVEEFSEMLSGINVFSSQEISHSADSLISSDYQSNISRYIRKQINAIQ